MKHPISICRLIPAVGEIVLLLGGLVYFWFCLCSGRSESLFRSLYLQDADADPADPGLEASSEELNAGNTSSDYSSKNAWSSETPAFNASATLPELETSFEQLAFVQHIDPATDPATEPAIDPATDPVTDPNSGPRNTNLTPTLPDLDASSQHVDFDGLTIDAPAPVLAPATDPEIPAEPAPTEQPSTLPPEPEAVPRTINTDKTIFLFGLCHSKLQTVGVDVNRQILKCQTGDINLFLWCIGTHAPPLIDPGVVFSKLRISGVQPNPALDTRTHIANNLVKALQSLKGVVVEKLYIESFNMNMGKKMLKALEASSEQSLSFKNISLTITDVLCVRSVASPFLEWFCKHVCLGTCKKGMALELSRCTIESIKCLDTLEIKALSRFVLDTLPNLKSLDCHLLAKAQPSSRLSLRRLAQQTKVSKAAANAITATTWAEVCMPMFIWTKICAKAEGKKTITVGERLVLGVGGLSKLKKAALQQTLMAAGPLAIEIRNQTNPPKPFKDFFKVAMDWVRVNDGKELSRVAIVSETSLPEDGPDFSNLGSLVSTNWPGLFNTKTLHINTRPVPIPS
ncbi:hypothetical protein NEDG_01251 [Nematocida displodere]|uniref:Uncharacterized protein n=1 Tax=Nematocida displodere TaxID=1805483 RepID=A0A177ED69_9MICR|nr:hypothetical protein NEDG_01251 [Nematocida displodere]